MVLSPLLICIALNPIGLSNVPILKLVTMLSPDVTLMVETTLVVTGIVPLFSALNIYSPTD